MTVEDPTARVVAEILAGRHDGRLVDIADAMLKRQREGGVQVKWRITLDDDVWDQDTVTGGEVRFAEKITGKSWLVLDPRASMDQFVAFVVAHYHKVPNNDGETLKLEDAIAKAEALPQSVIAQALSDYEVVDPPKGDPATSTST